MTSAGGTDTHGLPAATEGLRRGRSLATKLLLTASLITVTAAIVGIGAFAVFTNTAAVTRTDATGTVTLNPISGNAVNNRLSLGASNLAAGDTIQRTVDIKNTGSITLLGVTLTTNATVTSLLDTDTTNGLQMVIDKCSVAWTEAGVAPAYTYTCGGVTTAVLTTRAVVVASAALTNLVLTAGTDNYTRVTLTLPTIAPNTLQGLSSTVQYTFTATQRAATSQ